MDAESWFRRFRDRREPAALGAVFDLVADELRFEADGLGTFTAGPFDATVREEHVVARLPALGRVSCTVLREDGTPAVRAHVGLQRAGTHPFERAHQGKTDGEGRVLLEDVTPDEYAVHASTEVQGAGAASATVTVFPEQQATVVLTLRKP